MDEISMDEISPGTRVVLVINAGGEIQACLSVETGEPLSHEFIMHRSAIHERLLRRSSHERAPVGEPRHEVHLESIPIEGATANIVSPTANVANLTRQFGVDARAYCGGLMAVEIEGVDEASVERRAFDIESAFSCDEQDRTPGLISLQSELNDMVDAIAPFAASLDPLLRRYDEHWREAWHVALSPGQGHFAGIFKSDWNGVSSDVRLGTGHEVKVHYYAVVHAGLAEETAEQLKWLVRNNSEGYSWDELANSQLLKHAMGMARHARETLLKRLVDVVGARAIGEPIRTEYNTLHVTNFRVGNNMSERAVYYDMCTSTEKCEHGVLTMATPEDTSSGIAWLHGAPTRSRVGGGPWVHSETASAFPIFRNDAFGGAVEHLESFGYKNAWGKAFLKPIAVAR
jgi:alkylhydroperoxidase/carboxymuconolactone decarboxylase family protein YurZ